MKDVDLSGAIAIFAVANTPLFLARRLQSESVVHELVYSFDGEMILSALKDSIQNKPRNLEEEVFPYVLLVSLFFKGDALLEAAMKMEARNHPWFSYLAKVLRKKYVPGSYVSFDVAPPGMDEGNDFYRSVAADSFVAMRGAHD